MKYVVHKGSYSNEENNQQNMDIIDVPDERRNSIVICHEFAIA